MAHVLTGHSGGTPASPALTPQVHDHLWPQKEFEARLGCKRSYLQNKTKASTGARKVAPWYCSCLAYDSRGPWLDL